MILRVMSPYNLLNNPSIMTKITLFTLADEAEACLTQDEMHMIMPQIDDLKGTYEFDQRLPNKEVTRFRGALQKILDARNTSQEDDAEM